MCDGLASVDERHSLADRTMVVASMGADLGNLPGGGARDRLEVDALAEDVQLVWLDLDGDLLAGVAAAD